MAKRRKRGEGSIHLRKDGRWEGRVVVDYDEKGLPITKNVLAKTKTECTEKLNRLKETCIEQPTEKFQPDMTFGEWLDFWYQNYSKPKLRPTTQISDRTVWSCHTRIRTALDRAVVDGLIRINPADDCKLPPQNAKEMQLLSREEMQRFLIQAKEEGFF